MPSATPFVLTLTGAPHDYLARLIRWVTTDPRFETIVWLVEDLESSRPLTIDIGDRLADRRAR